VAQLIDVIVFIVAAAIVLGGAVGVILQANPVHAALSLIASFFGVAVLFVLQQAHFLALVQVVVYAGAIVVLFLFVIMLLGVDRTENVKAEPLRMQRPVALAGSLALLALILGGLFLSGPGGDQGAVALTGHSGAMVPLEPGVEDGGTGAGNIVQLGRDLLTRNVLAFEATALLLTIAVVGAVVLVRNEGAEDLVVDEPGTSIE
jgi:NADH-quinone oxidoreductase subunit J